MASATKILPARPLMLVPASPSNMRRLRLRVKAWHWILMELGRWGVNTDDMRLPRTSEGNTEIEVDASDAAIFAGLLKNDADKETAWHRNLVTQFVEFAEASGGFKTRVEGIRK